MFKKYWKKYEDKNRGLFKWSFNVVFFLTGFFIAFSALFFSYTMGAETIPELGKLLFIIFFGIDFVLIIIIFTIHFKIQAKITKKCRTTFFSADCWDILKEDKIKNKLISSTKIALFTLSFINIFISLMAIFLISVGIFYSQNLFMIISGSIILLFPIFISIFTFLLFITNFKNNYDTFFDKTNLVDINDKKEINNQEIIQ